MGVELMPGGVPDVFGQRHVWAEIGFEAEK